MVLVRVTGEKGGVKLEARYLLVVLIGIGMIYVGFFGVSFLNVTLAPPGSEHWIVKYDMNDLAWALSKSPMGISINPAGTLLMEATTTEVYARDSLSQYGVPLTWEIRVAPEFTGDLSFRVVVSAIGLGTSRFACLVLHKNTLQTYSNTFGDLQSFPSIHVSNQFYVYRVVMDSSTYTVFRDDMNVGSGVLFLAQNQNYFVLLGLTSLDTNPVKAHIDYFYAVTSAVSPTYRVTLSAYCNTEKKSVTAQVQSDGKDEKSTPCYYDFPIGTSHQIAVMSSNDVHPFLGWDGKTDRSVLLGVSGAGDHVAHFQEAQVPTYTVDISSYCDSNAVSLSVIATSDGISKATPCQFTYAVSTSHTITVPTLDEHGHPFLGWGTSTSGNTDLQVSSSGSHIAHYRANDTPVPSVHIPVTVKIYDGSTWNFAPNYPLIHYWLDGSEWMLLESISTGSNGVYDYQGSYLGKHKFTAEYEGQTYSAETPVCSDGEYWPLLLQLGSTPSIEYDWQAIMLYSGIGVTAFGSILFVYPKRRD